jgi:hypothetical protein
MLKRIADALDKRVEIRFVPRKKSSSRHEGQKGSANHYVVTTKACFASLSLGKVSLRITKTKAAQQQRNQNENAPNLRNP